MQRFNITGYHHQPRRSAVQSVNYAGTDYVVYGTYVRKTMKETVNQGSPPMTWRWMDDQPRRFVQNYYVFILVNQRKIDWFWNYIQRSRWRYLDDQLISSLDLVG